MRRIKLFEEFIQLIKPKKKASKVHKNLVIIPNWEIY